MANQLAKILANALGPLSIIGFGPMTLIRTEPGARGSVLTAATAPVETSYACKGRQGVKQSFYSQLAAAISGDQSRTKLVGFSILGATLPDGVTPRAGDRIVHSSGTFTIAAEGATDESGVGAVWACLCRAGGG